VAASGGAGAMPPFAGLIDPGQGWALVRPAKWSTLPAELWQNVLLWLTKCEGAAFSCTCNNIRSIVALGTFSWAPEAPPPPAPAFSSSNLLLYVQAIC
jgi:hypothetical protein